MNNVLKEQEVIKHLSFDYTDWVTKAECIALIYSSVNALIFFIAIQYNNDNRKCTYL